MVIPVTCSTARWQCVLAHRCCAWGRASQRIWLLALIGLTFCRALHVQADVGDAELLRTVSQEHRSNIERIRTWSGTIRESMDSAIPVQGNDPFVIHSKAIIEFACDRPRKSFRSNYLCMDRTTEGELEGVDSDNQPVRPGMGVMVVDDCYYRCSYDAGIDWLPAQKGASDERGTASRVPLTRVAVIRPAGERRKPEALGNEIDPFYWFTYRGKDTGECFGVYSGWAEEKADFSSRVTVGHERDRVTLRIGDSNGHNRYVADLQQGANLVEYDAADSTGTRENWKYEYESVSGIWVPKQVRLEIHGPDGSHYVRTLSWEKNVVNEPVEETEFALTKLGLRRGDKVQDERTGEDYVVQGHEYPASDAETGQVAVQSRTFSRTVLLAGCVALLLLILAVFALRRQGNRRHD